MRKLVVALATIATLALAAPETASARGFGGFHGGGGWHGGGGGWHGGGGYGRGGWGRGGWGGAGLAAAGFGIGLAAASGPWGYGYGPYYGSYAYDSYGSYPYAPVAYSGGYYGDECYVSRRRVWTPWGWRIRRVSSCGW